MFNFHKVGLEPFFAFFFKRTFLYLRVCQVLVTARGLFLAATRASLQLWSAGSRVPGLCSLQYTGSLVETLGSVVSVCGLGRLTAHGILIPQPGIKPIPPELAGRLLITGPPGKSRALLSINHTASK